MKEEKKLSSTTITLMIGTALFCDFSQWVFAFIFLDWLVGFFAFLTFLLWFWMHGIKFIHPKHPARIFAFGGATLAELVPLLAALPAWTASVAYIALSARIQEKIPVAATMALKVGAAAKARSVSSGKGFNPEISQKPVQEINRSMEDIKRRSLDQQKAARPTP